MGACALTAKEWMVEKITKSARACMKGRVESMQSVGCVRGKLLIRQGRNVASDGRVRFSNDAAEAFGRHCAVYDAGGQDSGGKHAASEVIRPHQKRLCHNSHTHIPC
eukprot:2131981-Amphidinium_carterae.1